MASTTTSKSSISDQSHKVCPRIPHLMYVSLGFQCNLPIQILYNPLHKYPREAEVVFFHDIQWSEHDQSSIQTWMPSSTSNESWPGLWLSKEFPSARILSAHYDAVVWKTNTAGHMSMYQIAENLGQDMLDIYYESSMESCPVFLVGHGLGGLIIKKIIHVMDSMRSSMDGHVTNSWEGRRVERQSRFLKNVKGVFYYNTPHLGSKLADYTTNCSDGNPLLEIIKTLSAEASQLNDWFSKWRRSHGCRTSTIHAALQTELVLWYGNWLMYVVEEASARSDNDDFYTCKYDHFSICKPSNQKDVRFQRLARLIFDGERSSRTVGPQAEIEDRLGREKLPRKVDAQIENRAENAACAELLTEILRKISQLRRGQGIWLKINDLEKIRKVKKLWNRLKVSLRKARLEQISVSGKLVLWTPLDDEDLSTDETKRKNPSFVERP